MINENNVFSSKIVRVREIKIKRLLMVGAAVSVIAACNTSDNEEANETEAENIESTSEENDQNSSENSQSDATASENLIDEGEKETGWVNYSGSLRDNEDYVTTDFIKYDPSEEYEISKGAYVSYYEDEEFLETILHNSPGIIKNNEEANEVRVSYQSSFEDEMILQKK